MARRVFCPGWTRSVLERMRRHRACLRPLRYMPGMLNTFLDLSGERTARIVHSLGDLAVLEYTGEGRITGDALYAVELGPRYLQYRMHHYTRGRVLRECPPDRVDEAHQILLLAHQRLAARPNPRSGAAEVCGTNNTIILEGETVQLSVALLHPASVEPLEGGEEPPWYVDRGLAPTLRRVRATLYAVGYTGEGLTHEEISVDALHPDPESHSDGGAPRPHLAFAHWDREQRSLRLVLMPLYSYVDEYRRALLLSSVLLLASTIGDGTLRDARKAYKKLAKHADRLGLPRPEGGLQTLLEEFPWAAPEGADSEDKPARPTPACSVCGAEPTMAGLEVLLGGLRTGALLIL